MGKKGKLNKSNNEKDHLEARALRKRAEHMSKQGENSKQSKKFADDSVSMKLVKEKCKEKKQAKETKSRKAEETPAKEERSNYKANKAFMEEKENTFVPPKAPHWNEAKLSQIIEKAKADSLAKFKELEGLPEIIETDDMTSLDQICIFNAHSTDHTLEEIRKKNEMDNESLQQNIKDLRQMVQNTFTEEFELLTERSKHIIALEELEVVKDEEDLLGNNDNRTIPSLKDFSEVTSIIRNFIAIRNQRLKNCFTTEYRRNKLADNYTNLLVQVERNKFLLSLLVFRSKNKKIGDRILEPSTKILERVVAQLRQQTERMFIKSNDTPPSKLWHKKLRRFDSLVEVHSKNISRMKTCLLTKQNEFSAKRERVKSVDQQLKEENMIMDNVEKRFESDAKKHDEYKKIFDERSHLKKLVAEIKRKISQDLLNVTDLKVTLDACKKEERNIDYLFKRLKDVNEKIEAGKKKWKTVDEEQRLLQKDLCTKNGILLRQEELKREMLLDENKCRNEISFLNNKFQDLLYQNQQLSKKLRTVQKQKIDHCPTFVTYENREICLI